MGIQVLCVLIIVITSSRACSLGFLVSSLVSSHVGLVLVFLHLSLLESLLNVLI